MSTLKAVQKSLNPFTGPTTTAIVPSSYRGGKDFWFFNADGKGHDILFNTSSTSSFYKAYKKCAPLNAVVTRKAQAFSNGKIFILNSKGKGRDNEAKSEPANKARALLQKPNPIQGGREFIAQQYTYVQVFGFAIVLPIKPVGFPNTEATKLWNLPMNLVNIEETKKNWLLADSNKDIIKNIVVDFGEERVNIPVADIFIVKDITPAFDNPVFPDSRLCSLEDQINNLLGAYNTRGRIIDDRGAQGIISSDSKDAGGYIPIKEDEKIAMHEEFAARYGTRRGQFQYIITSASVKWTAISQSTKDLMLFEEVEDDIMRVCDNFVFPYPLMSSNRTNSLGGNNIGEAKKLLYQDAIMPEADSFGEQWTNFFDLSQYNVVIQIDFSHVQALQEDAKKQAETRKVNNEARQIEFYNNLCTLNEWRTANGDDTLKVKEGAEDFGNMYYYELVTLGWKFGNSTSFKISQDDQQGSNQNANAA